MRNAIKEYIEYTDAEKSELWDSATFVFDTNVLLNLYRYSKDTRDALLESIQKLNGRIWMPYQIAYEFMKNRENRILKTVSQFENANTVCDKFIEDCSESIKKNVHMIGDDEWEELRNIIHTWFDNKKKSNMIVERCNEDFILDELLHLFDEKVGVPFNKEEREEIDKDWEYRSKNKIPPGYKDENKSTNASGDLILWMQILKYSKDNSKDIIFVSDDKKEDWWREACGRKLGPRIELRKEFLDYTGKKFHMYTMESFIKYSTESNGVKYDQSVIDEIETIDRQNYNFEIGAILSSHDNDEREFVSKRFQIAMRIEQLKEKNEKRKKALKEIEDNLEKGRYSANRIRQYEILQDKIEATNQTILMLESKYRGLGLLL